MTRPASALPVRPAAAPSPRARAERAPTGAITHPPQRLGEPGALRLVRSGWQILVVDPEPGVHQMTRLSLAGTEILGRPLQLLHALSGQAACQLLRDNAGVALVLTDLAMEHPTAGLDVVRCVREQLADRAVRIVLRSGQPAPAAERVALAAYDVDHGSRKSELSGGRLFSTVAAALRTYRDIRALERTRAGMQSMAQANAALCAAQDTPSLASESLRRLASFPFFKAAAFIDVTGPDAGLPQVSCTLQPLVVARLGALPPQAEPELPPLLLAHARVLPNLLVSEGDWHACCPRGNAGRRVVLVLRAQRALEGGERHLLELFMRNVAPAFGNEALAQEPAVLARLPSTLPEPRLRVGEDGVVLFCNDAARGWLAAWQTGLDAPLPEPWRSRCRALLAADQKLDTELVVDGQVLALQISPLPDESCVDLLARDLTGYRRARQRLQQAAREDAGQGQPQADPPGEPRRDPQASLRYQPIVDLASRRVVGVEAWLPRPWFGEPMELLGEALLERSLHDLQRWHRQGHHGLRLSLQVSHRALHEPRLLRRLRDALARSGVPARALQVELDETLLSADAVPAQLALRELHALGVGLSVDQFGGLSSLAALRCLPLSRLRLDRRFAAGLAGPGEARALVQAILSLARSLQLGVVATGVDTPAQAEALRGMGCGLAQGALYALPGGPAVFEPLLRQGSQPGALET